MPCRSLSHPAKQPPLTHPSLTPFYTVTLSTLPTYARRRARAGAAPGLVLAWILTSPTRACCLPQLIPTHATPRIIVGHRPLERRGTSARKVVGCFELISQWGRGSGGRCKFKKHSASLPVTLLPIHVSPPSWHPQSPLPLPQINYVSTHLPNHIRALMITIHHVNQPLRPHMPEIENPHDL